MRRFEFRPTDVADVYEIDRNPLGDERGFLARLYCADSFVEAGCPFPAMRQINHTFTRRRGTVRGLHFQRAPHAEIKLVSCLRGEVFDVALDLRRTSPSFLRWHGVHLSAQNGRALYIPAGFAHGFQALSDDCELIYLHSADYHAASEGGVDACDTRLGIDWPLPISERSQRDIGFAPLAADDERFFA